RLRFHAGAAGNQPSSIRKLSLAMLSGLALSALVLLRPVAAEDRPLHGGGDPSETYSELMSYVQQLGDEQPSVAGAASSPHNFTPSEDPAYSALRNFVREIGGTEDAAGAAARSPHGSAGPDDQTYTALRDFVREIGGDVAQPEQPKLLQFAQAAPPKAGK